MSDADLRELERRFRETGSVEDEAAWLRARVQAGELDRERLELAAYLGHEAAEAVLGEPVADLSLVAVLRRLRSQPLRLHPRVAVVRALVALARLRHEQGPPDSDVGEQLSLVDLAEEWCLAPEEWVERLEAELREWDLIRPAQRLPGYRFPAHAAVSMAVSNKTLSKAAYYGGTARVERLRQADPETDPREEAAQVAVAAVRAELVPWALGYSDPVRERVEARQRAEVTGE